MRDSTAPGMLLRDLERPNWLPPSSPEIILDDEGIPSDAFAVMTRVGSTVNPHLLRSARFVDLWETASIPEQVELLPNEERVPWANDQRLPY